ncbi:MAG: S9 family peptidase, partial [Cytophagaceae bacterium]
MRQFAVFLAHLALVAATVAKAQSTLPATGLPTTPKRTVSDSYFGKTVVDNYRWLEDMNSPEVKDWFKAQGDHTNATLAKIPGRDKLIQTFVEYDKLLAIHYGEIKKRGNTYFYRKTLPNEKAGKLYMRTGKTGPETLLFDPLTYEPGKTYLMTAFTPSSDGKKLVIGLQEGGAELSTVRTMDVATKSGTPPAFGPESITAVFGGEVSWLPDNSGFLYTPNNSMDTKDPSGNLNTKGRLHKLGTDPA